MSTSAITFDLDESIANAYLTLLRQQNKKVKLLLLKGLQEELDNSAQKEKVSAKNGSSLMGLRGILSDELSDEEVRIMHFKEKYGL